VLLPRAPCVAENSSTSNHGRSRARRYVAPVCAKGPRTACPLTNTKHILLSLSCAPPSRAFAVILNPTVKFIFAAGAAGGILWKLSNIMGSNNHYDHEMLGDGAKAPAAAKEAERCALAVLSLASSLPLSCHRACLAQMQTPDAWVVMALILILILILAKTKTQKTPNKTKV
jgi:hypothetical protein